MKRVHRIAQLLCPAITVLFSFTIGFVTMYLENAVPLLFMFMSVQFYLNWYLVYNINKKVKIPFTLETCKESAAVNTSGTRFWYCDKCKQYTRRPAQHCPVCRKCFFYCDHHCFFLGSCIIRQNMGNFILVCLYASFACIYSVFTVGPYLYDHFVHLDSGKLSVYYFALNFFFPITLAKFIYFGDESIVVFLVTLFNVSISITLFTMIYGVWKLYACLNGKQRYFPDEGKEQDVHEIFGSYGFMNVVFPFNGFLHSKSIDEKYELKSV